MDISRLVFSFFLYALFLTACESDESFREQEGNAALSLHLDIPSAGVELKSVSSNPSEPLSWTAWERAVDGRYLYRVSAFLISGNRLVATKDLELTGEPSEATIEFEGNFTHGNYKLMVVANYSAHSADDGVNGVKSYDGLVEFTSTVESILGKKNIDDFMTLYEDSFIKYKLASADGICDRVPQPLSLVKEIELHPGENVVEGELVRTYSRIRIMVENQSDEELNISSLSFSNIFTQKNAYVFANTGYIQDKTAIDAGNPRAIIPFTATASDPLMIPGKTSSVVFDAYILESKRNSSEDGYTYSFNLGYGGTDSFILKSETPINNPGNLSSGHYLLYNSNSRRYLIAGNNRVQTATLSSLKQGMELSDEYVWYLDGSALGTNQYYIGTAVAEHIESTSYYMANPSNSTVSLGPQKSVYFTFGTRSSNITMRSSGSGARYINVNNFSVVGSRSASNQSNFLLYSVETRAGFRNVNIPLQTIDPDTGQAVSVENIGRNDFISAVVLVKYNKNKGHFEFEVANWNSAGGDVDFN